MIFLLGSASCQAVETEWEFLFNLRGIFLQSVGFPFDSQGPGFSRNFLLLLSHYKAIENGNQTCSLGLVGRMTCLALDSNTVVILTTVFNGMSCDKTIDCHWIKKRYRRLFTAVPLIQYIVPGRKSPW